MRSGRNFPACCSTSAVSSSASRTSSASARWPARSAKVVLQLGARPAGPPLRLCGARRTAPHARLADVARADGASSGWTRLSRGAPCAARIGTGSGRPWSASRSSAAASDARAGRARRTRQGVGRRGSRARACRNRAQTGSRSGRARYGRRCRRRIQHRPPAPSGSTCVCSQTWLAQPCTLLASIGRASGKAASSGRAR